MKKLVLILAATAAVGWLPQSSIQIQDAAAWAKRAQTITIVRDDHGIAHVYGKTDADAVFGVMYAQAEDDFNRVESNYLDAIGMRAAADGEGEVYRDLRVRLFIDPDDLKAQYEKAPQWLKALMDAYADGLNYYLATHPAVDAARHQAFRAVDAARVQRREHRSGLREGESRPARSVLRGPSKLGPYAARCDV